MPQETSKMNSLKVGLLKCSVSKGMFGDEYAIEIAVEGIEGNRKASLFAAKSDLESVDMDQHTGWLKVKFSTEQPDYVVLPSTTLEQGNNVVKVQKDTLVSR